jgi:hypothetical protein
METLKQTADTVLTTHQIADRLYELLVRNNTQTVWDELFSENAQNIEPEHALARGSRNAGSLAEIRQKSKEFDENIEEVHSGEVGRPIVTQNHIALTMTMDVTMKGIGRTTLEEIVVYEVKEGKIVKEIFFY